MPGDPGAGCLQNGSSVPKLTCRLVTHCPYVWISGQVELGSCLSHMLSLIYLVRCRSGRNLSLRGGRWCICRITHTLYISEANGHCCRPLFILYIPGIYGYCCRLLPKLHILGVGGCCCTTEEGKEFYKTINRTSHKEPELLRSLLLTDWNPLAHFSLERTPRRRLLRGGGHAGFPLVYMGSPPRSITR